MSFEKKLPNNVLNPAMEPVDKNACALAQLFKLIAGMPQGADLTTETLATANK